MFNLRFTIFASGFHFILNNDFWHIAQQFHQFRKQFFPSAQNGSAKNKSLCELEMNELKCCSPAYPVHFGSPIRSVSTQCSHNCMSSVVRNLGNSINVRVIKSNVCFEVISTLFISSSTAIRMAKRVLAIDSEVDSQPISR